METQEKFRPQGQVRPGEPITPPSEPVTPPGEPVTPSSEPVTPPHEPFTPPTEPATRGDGAADPDKQGFERKIAETKARADELQDALLRARAEAENLRRRTQDDIAKAHKFAVEDFAEALVPVKDSLEAALKVDTASVDSFKQGVEMTLKQLSSAFEKNRLTEISPDAGEKFDPMKHQAISMVPANQSANTIVNVLQKGYMIADRLLRPALVTVSAEKQGS
ncbi:MAG TPA: nucleotide exchange factor GrpE [Noviherbaspirillum sp.]|uniref:nucleotide exchange factor GrpE n=1 Tax=Noviherbaspirillum sp. TaxID=1926288 RepID=UPI002B486A3C|nr:nucleotide exchange factor GrpE [Noviherbaspirillum sp.]HJV84370.1 nucleotide exchange factor GrpE [Noviherbaspirillum sp.]